MLQQRKRLVTHCMVAISSFICKIQLFTIRFASFLALSSVQYVIRFFHHSWLLLFIYDHILFSYQNIQLICNNINIYIPYRLQSLFFWINMFFIFVSNQLKKTMITDFSSCLYYNKLATFSRYFSNCILTLSTILCSLIILYILCSRRYVDQYFSLL